MEIRQQLVAPLKPEHLLAESEVDICVLETAYSIA
jgi:hypothetical protein